MTPRRNDFGSTARNCAQWRQADSVCVIWGVLGLVEDGLRALADDATFGELNGESLVEGVLEC